MYFGGLLKNSLIDYPGKVSCVLFAAGCNFHCPYCHNPELARGDVPPASRISLDAALEFLESRRGLLEGVVLSGGEPALDENLPRLCKRIKDLGYPVKLDTNGSRPDVLSRLFKDNCIDYVAMDIKAPLTGYYPDITSKHIENKLQASIELIMSSGRDYEFRTTCARPFAGPESIAAIAATIRGARRYVLQPFNPRVVLDPAFCNAHQRHPDDTQVESFRKKISPLFGECVIR